MNTSIPKLQLVDTQAHTHRNKRTQTYSHKRTHQQWPELIKHAAYQLFNIDSEDVLTESDKTRLQAASKIESKLGLGFDSRQSFARNTTVVRVAML